MKPVTAEDLPWATLDGHILLPVLPAIFQGSIPKVHDQVTVLNFGMETERQSGKCLDTLSSAKMYKLAAERVQGRSILLQPIFWWTEDSSGIK